MKCVLAVPENAPASVARAVANKGCFDTESVLVTEMTKNLSVVFDYFDSILATAQECPNERIKALLASESETSNPGACQGARTHWRPESHPAWVCARAAWAAVLAHLGAGAGQWSQPKR